MKRITPNFLQTCKNSMTNYIRTNLSPKEIESETKNIIEESKEFLEQLTNIPVEKQTFENVVMEYAYHEAETDVKFRNMSFLQNISTDENVRNASHNSEKLIESYKIGKLENLELYLLFRRIKEKEYETMNKVERKYIDSLLREYERLGIQLKGVKKEKMKKILKEIKINEAEFMKNLREDKTYFEFEKWELEGMDENFLNSLKKKNGKFLVSLRYPDVLPVLRSCKVAKTRKILDLGRACMCQKENTPLLEKTVEIRNEMAKLLGYDHFPDYAIEPKMAENAKNVKNFLDKLYSPLKEIGEKDMQKLINLANEIENEKNKNGEKKKLIKEIKTSDMAYYSRILREKELNVDENIAREYFPTENVIKKVYEFLGNTFGVDIKRVEKSDTLWHEDIQLYQVYKKDSDYLLGEFYLDLFPREGKFSHAGVFVLQPSCILKNGERRHGIACMVCNFSGKEKNRPSLLRPNEVQTFFHEMGHVLHVACSCTFFSRFAGYFVENDFLEFPSNFMENFFYKKEVMKNISSHYKTKEKIPDSMIKGLIKGRKFLESLTLLRILASAFFDLNGYFSEKFDSRKEYNKIMKDVAYLNYDPNSNKAASFLHLMMNWGYEAGYYSYLWSEVYSDDAFSIFPDDVFSDECHKIGRKFVKEILEVGAEKDAKQILRNFLGREPSEKVYFDNLKQYEDQ